MKINLTKPRYQIGLQRRITDLYEDTEIIAQKMSWMTDLTDMSLMNRVIMAERPSFRHFFYKKKTMITEQLCCKEIPGTTCGENMSSTCTKIT